TAGSPQAPSAPGCRTGGGPRRRYRSRRALARERLRRQVLDERSCLAGATRRPSRLGNPFARGAGAEVRAVPDESTSMSGAADNDRAAMFEKLFRGTRIDLLAYLLRRAASAED